MATQRIPIESVDGVFITKPSGALVTYRRLSNTAFEENVEYPDDEENNTRYCHKCNNWISRDVKKHRCKGQLPMITEEDLISTVHQLRDSKGYVDISFDLV